MLTLDTARFVLVVTVDGSPAYLAGRLDPVTWRMHYRATLDIDAADYFASRDAAERAARHASKHFDTVEIGTLD